MVESLPRGANFVRAKLLWEIGLHIAGNPETPYYENRDVYISRIAEGSPAPSDPFRCAPVTSGGPAP